MRHGRLGVAAFLLALVPAVAGARTWEVKSDTTNPGQRLTNALLNAQNGDRIHVHAPGPYVAPAGGWRITRSIELFGDGAGRAIFQESRTKTSTLLMPKSTKDPVLVIDLGEVPVEHALWNVTIHDLQISQGIRVPAPAHPASNGVHLKITDKKYVANLQLSRLFIYGMGNDGIHLEGKDGTHNPQRVKIEDCHSVFNTRHGLLALYVNQLHVQGGIYEGNWNKGAQLQGCLAAQVLGAAFERNQQGGAKVDSLAPSQLFLEGCSAFRVSGCHFEGFVDNSRSGVNTAVAINSFGGYIGECEFRGVESKTGSTGIYVGWSSQSVVVGTNDWAHVDNLVELADVSTTRSCTVMPQAVSYSSGVASRLVIPDKADRGHLISAATSNTSNLTAGFVLPRISAKVRDAMRPAASGGTLRKGLMIFNETSGRLNYFDGKAWREVTDAAAP